ncbi:MAG: hypothetical protein HY331_13715 [Chloroflexi bacterium]|nr:hypothetical protein [Chloroflexota bacterium]
MGVRTTIQLDEELLARLRRLLPPRSLNRFINEAVAEKVAELERQRIEQAMKEGYLATQDERVEVDRDWQVVDVEGWPA